MKSSITILLLSLITLLSFSCKKDTKTNSQNEDTKEVAPVTSYSINPSTTTVEWTAYKTTAKTPVKGKFLQLDIENPISSPTKQGALEGLSFNIPVSSFFSNNEERDNKIKTLFWNIMDNTTNIQGTFSKVSGTEEGTVNLDITMNNTTVSVPMNYTVADKKIMLNGTITNLMDWKMDDAFNSIHKACEVLHTGPDGISKTWEEVAISAVAVLQE